MIFPLISLQIDLLLGAAAGILSVLIISSLTTSTFDYDKKHVIVTGGSSGIGLECAKAYARKGANVTIVARDKAKLSIAIAELESCKVEGRRLMSISVDTSSSQEAVSAAFALTIRENGAADVLVNCAGTSVAGAFDELASSEFERMMKVNVLGSIYPTRAIIEGMKGKGSGRIVFVSSQAGQVALHGFTSYAASKWALRGLAEALQMEVKPFGIMVSVAYPPDTDTPGYKEEMLTKPDITKKLSESGTVFPATVVASDILNYSSKGYFGISTGLDGWLLKQVHPGMTPCNNIWEVVQGILFSPLCRFIGLFYIIGWDREISVAAKKEIKEKAANRVGKKDEIQTPMMTTRGSARKVKEI